MPEKDKLFWHVVFPPEVIKSALEIMIENLPINKKKLNDKKLRITLPTGETWHHDTDDEFFSDYRKGFSSVSLSYDYSFTGVLDLEVFRAQPTRILSTEILVRMPRRSEVERVFEVFEANAGRFRLPEPPKSTPKPKIFIGHGRDAQWKELKDHLHEKQGLDVQAYEIGARAALTVKEVLDEMLTSSSFALLVFTGEDQDKEGRLHARENVIHELGLFQGRLGWKKAIVLLEEGVNEFSNIQGTNQIRFTRGNIQATFGEILATIRREFSEA